MGMPGLMMPCFCSTSMTPRKKGMMKPPPLGGGEGGGAWGGPRGVGVGARAPRCRGRAPPRGSPLRRAAPRRAAPEADAQRAGLRGGVRRRHGHAHPA
jgi:hypothetical protein